MNRLNKTESHDAATLQYWRFSLFLQDLFSLDIYIGGKIIKTFCGFSMGGNQYWAGRVYDLCVHYMTGTPEGSTESGFIEKPGIEPATPGLQGISLIHYTTGASQVFLFETTMPK